MHALCDHGHVCGPLTLMFCVSNIHRDIMPSFERRLLSNMCRTCFEPRPLVIAPSESVPNRDETKHHMPDQPHEIILHTIAGIRCLSDLVFAMFGNVG